MFQNRQSSQKPSDELFERFRQSFSAVNGSEEEQTPGICALQDSTLNKPRFGHIHEDLDPTPKAPNEPFRFTPSLLDPTSAAFAAFANQPPQYYTPTPGAPNTTFLGSNHALQTPMYGIGIGTPLSMPTLGGNMSSFQPVTAADLQNYDLQTIQPHHFVNFQPYMSNEMQGQYSSIGFDRIPSPAGSPMQVAGIDQDQNDQNDQNDHATLMMDNFEELDEDQQEIIHEKFRYHVTLNAPTAMVKSRDEIPVTYLNKGQAYSISIVDTVPPSPSPGIVRYRTFIRISFQDEGQREKAAQCWQLWKEGRGINEAHQRGGKLQAVEYVENTGINEDDKKRQRIDVESSSFDGFSVIWSPNASGTAEATINVRFNFLSTDFSHSKGVKGIPVQLCAKTGLLSTGSPRSPDSDQTEVCYCKVKLFRDHGAERKLANDILHVKKTIEKLRQQSHIGDDPAGHTKKRKDTLGKSGILADARGGKVQKHKRTWSASSAASSAGGSTRSFVDDDVSAKLSMMQDMFTSTRPVSVLYLRGSDLDDPDLHPVTLPSEGQDSDTVWARRPSHASIESSNNSSSFVSPAPSSLSLPSHAGELLAGSEEQNWTAYHNANKQTTNGHTQPVRVKTSNDDGVLSGWIEAIGIDPSYVPPVVQIPKPDAPNTEVQYHRAVYLLERSQACLTASIAIKCGIDPSNIARTTRHTSSGLSVLLDDEMVKEMPEGQDMKVQLLQCVTQLMSPPQSEWSQDMSFDADSKMALAKGWELRLTF